MVLLVLLCTCKCCASVSPKVQDALREELKVHLADEGGIAEEKKTKYSVHFYSKRGLRNISDEFQDSSVGLRGVQWQ